MGNITRAGRTLSICFVLLIAAGGAAAFAQTSGPTFPVLTNTESLTTDAAYDPAHNLYFVVAGRGAGMLRGAFVTPAGTVVSSFEIGEPVGGADLYFEAPRVSYCPDYAAFLVVWTNGYPATNSNLWARGIGANADGSPHYYTPQFRVETGVVKPQQPAIAYSPASHEFLVAYTMERTYEMRVRRISLISGVSHPLSIAAPAEYPSVGYNSTTNEFLVAYRYEPDVLADIQAVRIQAGPGGSISTPISVVGLTPSLMISQPDVQFDPVSNRYFVTWWQQDSGGGATFGRFLNADGSDAGLHVLERGAGSYDCLAAARNPVDGRYFVTSCYPTATEVFGVVVNADGSVGDPLFQVTYSSALHGAYGSRVAANGLQPGWLVTAAIDQSWIAGQMIGTQSGAATLQPAPSAANAFSFAGSNRPAKGGTTTGTAAPRTGGR